ncbi:hypothetical protein JD844_024379 [Phrynosoma platyrhinos]|uniref:Sulfotransferase n=1 Tax=Phrynosoma platyrhinos TaxID=52577 RepID=A0ABQ7SXQ9_PHRPL|nr:hypothetical protein JD844_024379 [Phrynosoma platyrhinos]
MYCSCSSCAPGPPMQEGNPTHSSSSSSSSSVRVFLGNGKAKVVQDEEEKDLRSSVLKICNFLGKRLTEEELGEVLDKASFSKMSVDRRSNYTTTSPEILDFTKGRFLRKADAWEHACLNLSLCLEGVARIQDRLLWGDCQAKGSSMKEHRRSPPGRLSSEGAKKKGRSTTALRGRNASEASWKLSRVAEKDNKPWRDSLKEKDRTQVHKMQQEVAQMWKAVLEVVQAIQHWKKEEMGRVEHQPGASNSQVQSHLKEGPGLPPPKPTGEARLGQSVQAEGSDTALKPNHQKEASGKALGSTGSQHQL